MMDSPGTGAAEADIVDNVEGNRIDQREKTVENTELAPAADTVTNGANNDSKTPSPVSAEEEELQEATRTPSSSSDVKNDAPTHAPKLVAVDSVEAINAEELKVALTLAETIMADSPVGMNGEDNLEEETPFSPMGDDEGEDDDVLEPLDEALSLDELKTPSDQPPNNLLRTNTGEVDSDQQPLNATDDNNKTENQDSKHVPQFSIEVTDELGVTHEDPISESDKHGDGKYESVELMPLTPAIAKETPKDLFIRAGTEVKHQIHDNRLASNRQMRPSHMLKAALAVRKRSPDDQRRAETAAALTIQTLWRGHSNRYRFNLKRNIFALKKDKVRFNPFVHDIGRRSSPPVLVESLVTMKSQEDAKISNNVLHELRLLALALQLIVEKNVEHMLLTFDMEDDDSILMDEEKARVIDTLQEIGGEKRHSSRKSKFLPTTKSMTEMDRRKVLRPHHVSSASSAYNTPRFNSRRATVDTDNDDEDFIPQRTKFLANLQGRHARQPTDATGVPGDKARGSAVQIETDRMQKRESKEAKSVSLIPEASEGTLYALQKERSKSRRKRMSVSMSSKHLTPRRRSVLETFSQQLSSTPRALDPTLPAGTSYVLFESAPFKNFVARVPEEDKQDIEIMFHKLYDHTSSEHRMASDFPTGLLLSGLENRCYQRLCQVLVLATKKLNPANEAAFILTQLRNSLAFLRKLEFRAASRREHGFLNKSDNLLALLLFRDRNGIGRCPVKSPYSVFNDQEGLASLDEEHDLSEKLFRGLQTHNTLTVALRKNFNKQKRLEADLLRAKAARFTSDKDREITQHDDVNLCDCFHDETLRKVITVFTIAVVMLGLLVVWFVWHSASSELLTQSISTLALELQKKQSDYIAGALGFPVLIAELCQVALSVGDLPIDTTLPGSDNEVEASEIDKYLLTLLQTFNDTSIISGVYVALENGDMTGVWADVASESFLVREITASQSTLFTYALDTSGVRDFDAIETGDGSYDPTERPWFNLTHTGWTDVYAYEDGDFGITYHNAMPTGNGVWAVDLTLSALSLTLSQLDLLRDSISFVINTQGDLVATSDYSIFENAQDSKISAFNVENEFIQESVEELLEVFDGDFTRIPTIDDNSGGGWESLDLDEDIAISAARFHIKSQQLISVVAFSSEDWLRGQNRQDLLSFGMFFVCFMIAGFLCWVAYLLPDKNVVVKRKKRKTHFSIISPQTGLPVVSENQLDQGDDSDDDFDVVDADDTKKKHTLAELDGVPVDEVPADCSYTGRAYFQRRQRTAVKMSVALILLLFGMLWVLWSISVENEVDETKIALVATSVTRLVYAIQAAMHRSSLAHLNVASRLEAGGFFDPVSNSLAFNISTSAFESAQIFMVDTFDAFEYEAEGDSLLGNLHFYLNETQDFMLIGECEDETGETVDCVGVQTSDVLGGCYGKYGVHANHTIDWSSLLFKDCNFDPRLRDWHSVAVEEGTISWTPLYTFADGELGVTMTMPLYLDPDSGGLSRTGPGSMIAAASVDIYLHPLSIFLSQTLIGAKGDGDFLIVQDTPAMEVIGVSTLETSLLRNEDEEAIVLFATELDPDESSLGATASFLGNMMSHLGHSNFSFVQDWVEVPRKLQDDLTFLARLHLDFDLEWILVITTAPEKFYGGFVDMRTLTMFLSMGSATVICIMIYKSLSKFSSSLNADKLEHKLAKLSRANVSKSGLSELHERISDDIINSYAETWRRKSKINNFGIDGDCEVPVLFEDLHSHAEDTALDHILDSANDRNILDKVHVLEQGNYIPRVVFDILHNRYYYSLVQSSLFVHVILSFWEPSNQAQLTEEGVSQSLMWTEFVCIIIEFSYYIMTLSMVYKWGWSNANSLRLLSIDNFLSNQNQLLQDMLIGVVITAVIVDWALMAYFRVSFEFFLPLKPLLVCLLNKHLLRALRTLFLTLWTARQVFILYFLITAIAAVMGLTLLHDVNRDVFENSYETFVNSMVTTFVYMSTGENMTDVIYPAFELNPIYVYYYLVITILGLFFLTAIAVGAFEQGYSVYEKRGLNKTFLFRRTGAVAGFVLLDVDESDKLTGQEFAGLLRAIAKRKKAPELSDQAVMRIFARVDTDFDGTIDMLEFVKGVEEVFNYVDKCTVEASAFTFYEGEQVVRLRKFLKSSFVKSTIMLLLVCDGWAFTAYGITPSKVTESVVDYFTFIIMLINAAEILARIIVNGERFWNPTKFVKNAIEIEFGNWVDFLSVYSGLAGALVVLLSQGTIADNWRKFFVCLPLIRLLTINRQARHLLWCLVLIVPMFLNLLVLLAMVYIVFAVYGMWLFADKFQILDYSNEAPPGNFDSLQNSVFVLFQLMVGEAWHEQMYAAIKVSGWNAAYYFIAFTIIVALLFTNLFVGVILSVYQLAEPMNQPSYKDLMKKRQEELEVDEH